MLRHFHHRIDNNRHKWLRTSNHATPHRNSRGNPPSLNSGENEEPEAETVSVFPDRPKRTASTSSSRRNVGETESSSGSCENKASGCDGGGGGGGDGGESAEVKRESTGKPSQEAAGLIVRGDETDSARLSPQHAHSPFPTLSNRERDREHTTGSKQFHPTSEAQQFGDDSPLTLLAKNRTMSSQGHVSSRVDCPPTGETSVVSQRNEQRTLPSHQGGHLKLSGNGTLSLSFGSESAHRKRKANPDGT